MRCGARDQVTASADRSKSALTDAIAANISKFRTPAQNTASSYSDVAGQLSAAGVNVSVEGLMGASKAEILAFCIKWLLDHHTTAPIRAICARFGTRSTNGASECLQRLEVLGYVRRVRYCHGLVILRHPNGRPFEIVVK